MRITAAITVPILISVGSLAGAATTFLDETVLITPDGFDTTGAENITSDLDELLSGTPVFVTTDNLFSLPPMPPLTARPTILPASDGSTTLRFDYVLTLGLDIEAITFSGLVTDDFQVTFNPGQESQAFSVDQLRLIEGRLILDSSSSSVHFVREIQFQGVTLEDSITFRGTLMPVPEPGLAFHLLASGSLLFLRRRKAIPDQSLDIALH